MARFRLFTVALVAVSVFAMDSMLYLGFRGLIYHDHEQSLETLTQTQGLRLESALDALAHDVRFLAELPATLKLAASLERAGEATLEQDHLAEVFHQLLELRPHYAQVRYIEESPQGEEILRLERRGDRIVRVPDDGLQLKGERAYVRRGLGVRPGQVYFSEIELNREHGEISVPHQPVLRASVSVGLEGRPVGLVIVNLDFEALVSELYASAPQEHAYYIVDHHGTFLLHPDPSRRFGDDLGSGYDLDEAFPATVLPRDEGTSLVRGGVRVPELLDGATAWVRFEPVRVFQDQPERALTLIVAASEAQLLAAITSLLLRALVLALLVVTLVILFAYSLSRWFVRPLDAITLAAEQITKTGKNSTPLPVERSDEIGILAQAFQHMVSSLKNSEAQLRRSNEHLEQFAYTASHDLQEPLRMVSCYMELLEADARDRLEPSDLHYITIARESTHRMKVLIDGLLALCRVETRGQDFETCDLDRLLDEVLDDLTLSIEEAGATIVRDSLPTLQGDPVQLRMVFQNLLSNALKFRGADPPRVEVAAQQSEDGWQLSFRDNGIGFASRDADRMFQMFQRLHRQQVFEGSGIGLSVARQIVERHGGEMWAESEPGVGSVFYLTLPTTPPSPEHSAS